MSFEEQVRERAYHIWLAGGMADGYADEHWVCAERTLRGETASYAEPVVIITKAAAKPAAKVTKAKATAKPAAEAKVAKVAKLKIEKTRAAKATAAKPAAKAKAVKAGAVQPTAH